MIFRITVVDTDKPENVIERYPCLHQFSFDGGYIVVKDLDELIKLSTIIEQSVIIHTKDWDEKPIAPPEIEIYDGYRE